jgi:ribosomal protein L11 methyltransferase
MLIEKFVQPRMAFIDVGCGSGILSIAAAKLGAEPVLGVDKDSESVYVASENAEANNVLEKVTLKQGSVGEILKGEYRIRKAPLVAANILAKQLIKLIRAGLCQLCSQGGVLILSGLLEDDVPQLKAALEKNDHELLEKLQIEDWVAIASKARRSHQQ